MKLTTYLIRRGVRAVQRVRFLEVDVFSIDGPDRAKVLWDMVDGPMPRGLLGVGDPDVHIIDSVPTMFLGGFSTSFKNRLYRATLPTGKALDSTRWVVDTDEHRRVKPLVADPPRDGCDRGGMHTPSLVPAVDGNPARIYYTGRATTKQYGPRSSYSIGVIERHDDQ